MANVKIIDETATGKVIQELNLLINAEMLTAEELISRRVRFEVEKYNNHKEEIFNGLIQPTDSERLLNGYKMKGKKEIDPDAQVEKALEAFNANGFFIIANNRQLETLEEHILIDDMLKVSFIKLVPLVGG
jgi:hypothetical protein